MPPTASADLLFGRIAELADDASRKSFFARRRRPPRAAFVRRLIEAVVPHGRVDTRGALHLAESAVFLARRLRDREILALSLRAKANALNLAGKNQLAVETYRQALELFESLKNEGEIARTLSASLQALIMLGEYDCAISFAGRAREIFTRFADYRRLARLDNNVGNIYHRQDRFEEALACYQRSYQALLPAGDSEELAIALNNISLCLISLNDFPRALASYQQIRNYCNEHKLPLLRSQADYNIAYLYYFRGEYSRAIEMLRATRDQAEKLGDEYVSALCYLDLSEIYLELNLSAEALDGAEQAAARFKKLGIGYEEAKALANAAIALSHTGKAAQALELFAQARARFLAEKNHVWPSLIDLYQALVLFNEGRLFESRRLCLRAAQFFDSSQLSGKAVLCRLLLSRLSLRADDPADARLNCERALDRLGTLQSPVLQYQAQFLYGQILQVLGDSAQAYASYQRAREALETLRSSLRGEELKISFMKNRLEVYESLVALGLSGEENSGSREDSFHYIELAKSRSLAELLMYHGYATPAGEAGQSELVRKIRGMREELNWYYRRIETEQLRTEQPSFERIANLQKQALCHENELLRAFRELPSETNDVPGASAHDSTVDSLERIREALPANTALLEYFSLRDQFIAAVVTRRRLDFVPLSPLGRVANLVRMLRFQIAKFGLGADYVRTFQRALLDAARAHLHELHGELVEPLRSRLDAEHLVIAPYGVLHYLPFHALFDGERYLLDRFSVSYAPSGSVYALCRKKTGSAPGSPLVIGVPDARAPRIEDEVRAIAGTLAGSELVIGPEAGEQALRAQGTQSPIIHIATHGTFRNDNPMFSGIRLGPAYLNLYDLYQLRLNADIVALSGCATGLNVVAAGDELLGLVRGLLYAGAKSLLLTLWDVHDQSTTDFMICLYKHFQGGIPLSDAIRKSMQDLRERHPHPYYWAPFVLTGKA